MSLNGEVELTHEGKTYRMTINHSALCTFERIAKEEGLHVRNGYAMLGLLSRGGVQAGLVGALDVQALIYGGLRVHHPDMTLDLAGAILDSNAGILLAGIEAASPQQGDLPQDASGAEGASPGKPKRAKKRAAK